MGRRPCWNGAADEGNEWVKGPLVRGDGGGRRGTGVSEPPGSLILQKI